MIAISPQGLEMNDRNDASMSDELSANRVEDERRIGERAVSDIAHTAAVSQLGIWAITGTCSCQKCESEFEASTLILPNRVIRPLELCERCQPMPHDEQVTLRKSREERWKATCVDECYRDDRFVQYAPPEIKKAFRDWWVLDRTKGKGIYAVGDTGSFKTTLMWYVAHKLTVECGKTVKAFSINELADRVLDSFSVTGAHGALIQNLSTVDYLFLDDIDKAGVNGKSQAPPSLTKALWEITDRRYRKNLPTLITTNALRDKIVAIYGEEYGLTIARRLRDNSTIIETTKLMAREPKRYNDN